MPGDEVHEEAAAVAKAVAEAGRARIGPRHAAPRKPLLTRLHMPAGKAIAMAAMPSAVLMGMGLMPQLASAKPVPKSPFKDGPCVSAPDKEEEAEKDAAAKKAEEAKKAAEEKAAKEAAEKKAEEARKAAEEKAAKEKAEAGKDDSGSSGSGSADADSDESGTGPSEPDAGSDSGSGSDADSERNPLDPLGLGDAVRDLLTPEEKEAAEEKAAEEEAAEEKAAAEEAAGSEGSLTKPVEDTVGKVEKGLEDTTDALEKDVEDAKDGLEEDASSDTGKSGEESATGADEDGDKAFPCVEEKKVAGKNEQTPVVLPNRPWLLEASSLGLHGLDYKGVVNVRTANGSTKQALKFTAKSVDIGDLHQIVDGPNGTKYHVEAAKGSNSTIRDGQVTLYTERLEGNLFGLIPIVFDPEHPPPLDIPEAYFTQVKIKQAGQFGGTLTIPGLQQSITR